MQRRKYHPKHLVPFLRHLREIGKDHVVLGSAVVVESNDLYWGRWEWPTEDDNFFFNISQSFGYPELG